MSDKAETNNIGIKVRSQRGEEVHFKIKSHTKMEKVIKAFCDKIDVDPTTIRLTFDGKRVDPNQTPADLDLEEGDILDVLEQQTGGAAF